jgi:hypothetical protein
LKSVPQQAGALLSAVSEITEGQMVSITATQHRHIPETPKAKANTGEDFTMGKSAESVGHRARAMVAETGDLEPGAQGRAASTIARMDVTVLTPPVPVDESAG